MKIKIALEWFLNPDHLPIVAGVVTGEYAKAGLDVEIIEPKEHYDGFESLKKGEIDIHINEPLHLYEHYFDGIKSLGALFETNGGVMIKKDSINKLKNNQKLLITTPASNDITNKIGFEILNRYAKKNGFTIDSKNVEFIETDFYHIKNLKSGVYDGAWLCFYNFEGIEAEYEKFDNLFIDQYESPYPNFSALELMSSDEVLRNKRDEIKKFIEITSNMVDYCKNSVEESKKIYYFYTKEDSSELMDSIIEDTVPRFFSKIEPSSSKWRELYKFLEELDIVELNSNQYNSIWEN